MPHPPLTDGLLGLPAHLRTRSVEGCFGPTRPPSHPTPSNSPCATGVDRVKKEGRVGLEGWGGEGVSPMTMVGHRGGLHVLRSIGSHCFAPPAPGPGGTHRVQSILSQAQARPARSGGRAPRRSVGTSPIPSTSGSPPVGGPAREMGRGKRRGWVRRCPTEQGKLSRVAWPRRGSWSLAGAWGEACRLRVGRLPGKVFGAGWQAPHAG